VTLPKYSVTFDIEWAPDSSIQKCLELLTEFNVKATFFATHHTDLNKEIIHQGHELGIHPNFLPGSSQGKSVDEIIETCLEFAPTAWCMRTHSLVQSSPLLHEIFSKYPQLTMDISLFMHKAPHVQRTKWAFDGVFFDRIMYNWEDDAEFYKMNFSEESKKFFGPITVFDFHPIHVHLNSSNGSEYKRLKESNVGIPLNSLNDKKVCEFTNTSDGVHTFFRSVLASNSISIPLEEIR